MIPENSSRLDSRSFSGHEWNCFSSFTFHTTKSKNDKHILKNNFKLLCVIHNVLIILVRTVRIWETDLIGRHDVCFVWKSTLLETQNCAVDKCQPQKKHPPKKWLKAEKHKYPLMSHSTECTWQTFCFRRFRGSCVIFHLWHHLVSSQK